MEGSEARFLVVPTGLLLGNGDERVWVHIVWQCLC
jgi:hypothetical protein